MMSKLFKIGFVILIILMLSDACGKRVNISQEPKVKLLKNLSFPKIDFEKSPKLRLLVWHDFIPRAVYDIFRTVYGIEVVPTLVDNNQGVWKIMRKFPDKYDLIFISNHMVKRMIKAGYIRRLNHDHIKNIRLLEEKVFRLKYDKGLRYTIPIAKGCVGIAFNINYVPGIPRTWGFVVNAIKNDYLNFRIGVRNEYRFSLGLALIYLGYSPNTTNLAELEEAKRLLIANIRHRGMTLIGPESTKRLIDEDLLLALDWNGNAAAALKKNYNIRFLLPEGKAIVSYESIAINSKSKNVRTAEFFIDFLLIPQISALITNYNYFANCNPASLSFIHPIIRNGPGFIFPKEKYAVFLEDLGENDKLYERIWEEVLRARPDPSLIKLPLPEVGIYREISTR